MRDFSGQQSEDLYELIGERPRSGSIITTANRAPADWYPLFPNPVLAEGILDRLLNSAHQIVMTGRSFRPQLRPDRATGTGPIDSNADSAVLSAANTTSKKAQR
jgi:DNA replication protein DnaC